MRRPPMTRGNRNDGSMVMVNHEKRAQHKLPGIVYFPDLLLNLQLIFVLWEYLREAIHPERMTAVVIDSHGVVPIFREPSSTIPINETSHFAVE